MTLRGQRTLKQPVSVTGVGLHTGVKTRLTFQPAAPDTGYVLVREDLPGHPELPARVEHVIDTQRGTTLGARGVEVHTVEHVLAALYGLGIDNCRIALNAIEPPIMDGSALPFVRALQGAGTVESPGHPIQVLRVSETLIVGESFKSLVAWPQAGLSLSYALAFSDTWLPAQQARLKVQENGFCEQVAPARTFCFEREVEWLRSQGLAQGGSLENAVVVGEQALKNGPLRFEHELAYHKLLDLLGDLALLGQRVEGHFTADRSGHGLNVAMVKRLRQLAARQAERGRTNVIIESKEIEQLLPHRYPILLVDRILELEINKRVVGIKNVTRNEPFFQGHFPGHPIMPGVLIVEAMAQCGGVLLMKSVADAKDKVVYFMTIDNVKFRKPVLPGDQLRFELTVDKIRSRIARMHGDAFVGEELVCEADLTSTIMDR